MFLYHLSVITDFKLIVNHLLSLCWESLSHGIDMTMSLLLLQAIQKSCPQVLECSKYFSIVHWCTRSFLLFCSLFCILNCSNCRFSFQFHDECKLCCFGTFFFFSLASLLPLKLIMYFWFNEVRTNNYYNKKFCTCLKHNYSCWWTDATWKASILLAFCPIELI